jgi:hypothetical protein
MEGGSHTSAKRTARGMWVGEEVDDGGSAEAADAQASAADPTCWLDVDGGHVRKSTLVCQVFWRKGTSNDHTRRAQSMYGSGSQSQATTQGDGVEDGRRTGDPVSVVV